jgi:membrane protein DedA with SNARE-associated domain
MPFSRFFALALLGSIPWIVGLAVLGQAVGSNWETWRHSLEYVDYVGAAIVVGLIVWLIVRRTRGGGGGPAPDVAS